MSNTVSKFLHYNSSYPYNSCLMIAESLKVKCFISFSSLGNSSARLIVALPDSHHTDFNSVYLTKDQITHLLSLDCPDAFIAYALTLCPCPPETAKPALVAVDWGILVRHNLLSETVPYTSEYPLPDCPVCHEPVDIDQFNHNGGACNFCYHELSNDSYLKSFDLERRLL